MFVMADAADPLLSFGSGDGKSGMLTDILRTFTTFIESGTQKVVDAEAKIAGALIALQLLKMIVDVGLVKGSAARSGMAFIGAVTWYQIATNAVAVTKSFTEWMGSLGTFVSGGSIDANIMKDPSLFMDLGYKAFGALFAHAVGYGPLMLIPGIAYTIVGYAIYWCYVLLGFVVIYIVVDSAIDVVLGVALLPFVIEPMTSFLALRGIALILNAGMGLGKISLVVGLCYGYLKNITLQPDPTLRDSMDLMCASIGCMLMCGVMTWKLGAGAAVGAAVSAFRFASKD